MSSCKRNKFHNVKSMAAIRFRTRFLSSLALLVTLLPITGVLGIELYEHYSKS